MKTTDTRGINRITRVLAEAWADCRYASRRTIELQLGIPTDADR